MACFPDEGIDVMDLKVIPLMPAYNKVYTLPKTKGTVRDALKVLAKRERFSGLLLVFSLALENGTNVVIHNRLPNPIYVINRNIEVQYYIANEIEQIRRDLEYKGNNFAVVIFKVNKVPLDLLSDAWKSEMRMIHPEFVSCLEATKDNNIFLYISKTEVAEKTLQKLVVDVAIRKTAIPKSLARSIAFQITFAMAKFQRLIGLQHHDLTLDNVLAFKIDAFRIPEKTDTPWTREFPYVFKITDFELSVTTVHKRLPGMLAGVYPFWPAQPVNWLFMRGLGSVPFQHREDYIPINSDVWSLGLLIIISVIQGADIERFEHFTLGGDTLFFFDDLYSMVESHESYSDVISDDIIEEVNDTSHWESITDLIGTLGVMCQVQEFLGNGFLPPRGIYAGDYNDYYYVFERLQKKIIQSCRVWPTKTAAEMPLSKNVNVFEFLIRTVESRIGNDGLDFVKRCMSWESENSFTRMLEHSFLVIK